MKKTFVLQFVQLLQCLLCDVWVNTIIMKNLILSVDQYRTYMLQFLVHFVNLLRLPHHRNGFSRIQETVMDHIGSKPPWNSSLTIRKRRIDDTSERWFFDFVQFVLYPLVQSFGFSTFGLIQQQPLEQWNVNWF